MTLNLHLPSQAPNLKPRITVVGVGGAGGNAVNNMITAQLEGVSFVIANTDAQALDHAQTDRVIQLGANVTQGLGAGACPDVGRASAEEAAEEIMEHVDGSHMVFITAGMGGGTGTGAAPVVARMAKEQGILTVAVVTKPFHFEGTHRMKLAEMGLEELQKYVDTMIVIPNQNLFRIANEKTTFADAFRMADEVLHSGVRGVTDLMVMPGLINLDFADIRTVMREMGKAMMGTGEAEGDRRAVEAAEAAISNPLLDDVSMKGARGVLINITGGPDMTLFEVDEAANRIRDEVDPDANIIFGSTFNDNLTGKMRVSVVATGIDQIQALQPVDRNGAGFSQRPAMVTPVRTAPTPAPAKPKAEVKPEPVARERVEPVARSVAVEREEPVAVAAMASTSYEIEQGGLFADEEVQEAPVRRVARHSPTRFETVVDHEGEEHYSRSESPEPGFISPRAEQPKARHTVEPGQEHWRQHDPAPREEGPSFLQRMTARFGSQSAQLREEEELPAPRQVRSNPARYSKPVAEEDYLEIPAFLRRQAN